jgi:hypothetical protein
MRSTEEMMTVYCTFGSVCKLPLLQNGFDEPHPLVIGIRNQQRHACIAGSIRPAVLANFERDQLIPSNREKDGD